MDVGRLQSVLQLQAMYMNSVRPGAEGTGLRVVENGCKL